MTMVLYGTRTGTGTGYLGSQELGCTTLGAQLGGATP